MEYEIIRVDDGRAEETLAFIMVREGTSDAAINRRIGKVLVGGARGVEWEWSGEWRGHGEPINILVGRMKRTGREVFRLRQI